MSKTVKIAGATYSSVPAVSLPDGSGNNNLFYDCTGTKTITENGTEDVTGYASVNVNVESSGGISGLTELYSNDAVSVSYTSTSAGTAKSITGISNLARYPLLMVIIENTDTTSGKLKFIRSATVIGNASYASGAVSVVRYGTQQYYGSGGAVTNLASTSYGLWGYTINASGTLTIRGRCNGSYYTSLSGTYKIKVLALNA